MSGTKGKSGRKSFGGATFSVTFPPDQVEMFDKIAKEREWSRAHAARYFSGLGIIAHLKESKKSKRPE